MNYLLLFIVIVREPRVERGRYNGCLHDMFIPRDGALLQTFINVFINNWKRRKFHQIKRRVNIIIFFFYFLNRVPKI